MAFVFRFYGDVPIVFFLFGGLALVSLLSGIVATMFYLMALSVFFPILHSTLLLMCNVGTWYCKDANRTNDLRLFN